MGFLKLLSFVNSHDSLYIGVNVTTAFQIYSKGQIVFPIPLLISCTQLVLNFLTTFESQFSKWDLSSPDNSICYSNENVLPSVFML